MKNTALIYFFFLSYSVCSITWAYEITVNELYAQITQVNEEVKLIKQHFNIQDNIKVPQFDINLFPRHSWHKTYEILLKINKFRNKHDRPIIAIAAQEPLKKLLAVHVYEQVRRILTELEMLKAYLNISEQVTITQTFHYKTFTDTFNLLNHVSYQLDQLNGIALTPSDVFAQAMRIYEDIEIILETLEITDDTIPPVKQPQARPSDTFAVALEILKEIKKIADKEPIEHIELYGFKTLSEITPNEVFTLTGIILGEIQVLKAHLSLKHMLTPSAHYYHDRLPADAQQILGWCLRKIKLIHALK